VYLVDLFVWGFVREKLSEWVVSNIADIATGCHTPKHTEIQYDTLQDAAAHCSTLLRNTLQQPARHLSIWVVSAFNDTFQFVRVCTTLHYTATFCITPQHTATNYSTLQHPLIHCNLLQDAAMHRSTR